MVKGASSSDVSEGRAKSRLEVQVALLPTPTTQPMTGNGHARNLGKEINLLSTPRTSDTNGAGAHGTGGLDLRTAVTLLPTPTVGDPKNSRNSTAGRSGPTTASIGDTLSDIAWKMAGKPISVPMPTPLPDGPASSADRPPVPSTAEDA